MSPKVLLKVAIASEKMRFLLAGFYNTVFGYALFSILYLGFGDWLHYIVILVASHVVAVTNAYFSYYFLVFRDSQLRFRSYLRFHSVYLASLGLGLVLLPLLVEVARMSPLLSQAVVVAITVVLSYVFHKQFSFAR